MQLRISVPLDPDSGTDGLLDSLPARPAVFALFPAETNLQSQPYLSRTRDLRRRLARLLGKPVTSSKRLNLREVARRIDYQRVGSNFEAQWLLYLLNRHHYPRHYRHRLRLKPPSLLKVNLTNRFPRCYPTRRLANDGSLYYGPFPSTLAAERFASAFLDLFKIRRCVDDLNPDPSHPGCIYSQMRMCLAPCFAGCTDAEYQQELTRVVSFLDSEGRTLVRSLEAERGLASESTEFEHAAKLHRNLEKVHEVLRLRPGLVRRVSELHALVMQSGAEPRSVVFFRVSAGQVRGPATLSLDDKVSSPVPLDEQLHSLLEALVAKSDLASGSNSADGGRDTETPGERSKSQAPPWEPLALLARWYYSSFREGELLMLPPNQEIPHARLIRICRKLVEAQAALRL